MRERRVARARITLVSTALFAVAFAGLAVLLVTNVRGSLERHARSATREAVDDLTSGLRSGVDPEQIVSQTDFHIQPGIDFVILDSNGRVIAGTLAPAFVIGTAPEPLPGQIVETRITRLGDVEYTVAAANPLDDINRSIDTLAASLWVGVPLLTLLVGLIVWFLVGRALRPVAVAEARQRAFISDASHELRSPIATIRAELEVAMVEPSADWASVAGRVLDEQSRLEALVDDLLDLARLDEHERRSQLTDVDLDELVLDEARRTRRVPIDTTKVSAGRVLGEARLLARVVRNLLDNAARHARTRVAVEVRTRHDGVELIVDDDGPGVPEALRATVFERFARLEESRDRNRGGTGLGLAVVDEAARHHGGRVECRDSPLGGARFVVWFPASDISCSDIDARVDISTHVTVESVTIDDQAGTGPEIPAAG